MRPNLFIARTPLQVFNSQEARDRLRPGAVNHLWCVYRKDIDRQQMEQVSDGRWASITYCPLDWKVRNFPGRWIRQQRSQLEALDLLCTGFTKRLAEWVCRRCLPREVVVIDDGNESIVRDRDLGWRVEHRWFTCFPDETGNDIANDYRCFRARLHDSKALGQHVAFIGSPVYPRDVPDPGVFRRLMAEVRSHYQNAEEVVYHAHRYEDLEALGQWLEPLGFRVERGETILECALAQAKCLPMELATFHSTAIDTLCHIYRLPRTVFEMPESLVAEPRRKVYRELMADFRKRSIPMVSLSE